MLKKAFLIIFMLLSGVTYGSLRAQHNLFSHFNKERNGLSYDSIRDIFQDSRGYVWIGTYKGLSRYDGKRFKNYDRDDLGVISDFINVIKEDIDGNLWIGTDNGVVIYNYAADEFRRLSSIVDSSVKVPDDRIFAIERNSAGVMWVSSRDNGLYSYTPQTGAFVYHPLSEQTPVNYIYRITIDRNDNMFLAVYCDNIYWASSDASSCSPLDLGSNSDIFKGDDVEGVVLSCKSGDIIYVASKRNGLVEVDLRNGRCTTLYNLPKDVRPTNLTYDANKSLWLSTTNGLVCYSFDTCQSKVYYSDPSDQFSLSDSFITDVYKDRNGRLWVGTQYGGLDLSSPAHSNFTKCYTLSDGTSLEGAIIRCFAEDKSGNVWIATERMGLLKYSDDGLVRHTADIPKTVLALLDDDDCLWIGSVKGISRMDYATSKVRKYVPFDVVDTENRVLNIYKSHAGEIFVATTIGVMRYDRKMDRFEMIPELSGVTVEHMAEDSRGVLWLASYSTGVYSYDLKNSSAKAHYSPQTGNSVIPDMISSVCVDAADNTWIIGFSSGFFHYQRLEDTFREYSMETMPSLPTNVYFRALSDDYGHLWLSTDSGLIEFDHRKGTVRVYTTADGLLDNEFTKAAIQLRGGRFAFGSADGFVVFSPEKLKGTEKLANVTITDMYLDYEPIDQDFKSEKLSGNIDIQDEIVLEFKEDSFGFSFAVLDSSYPASDRILCMLDGYDTQWRDVSVEKVEHWTDVPAGNYKLLLSNGEFSGQFVDAHNQVTIVVRPRFWASPLGIFIIISLALTSFFLIVFLLLRRQKILEKRRLEAYRVRKEQEMMKEKMTFFSNIIHEIKTPLTLIRTPLQKILSSGSCTEDLRDEIEVISNSTDYMNDLVKELLEFVRLEEHGYVLDLKNIDIVERLGFLAFNFYETAKDRNIKLQFSHTPETLVCAVDANAFRKIINNLLDNGVKYAESYIKVDLYLDADDFVVSFKNDGATIPVSRRESIFKPFVQFSEDVSPYSQSFGIGLAYARNLAELHGGTLTLGECDKFTEFVLRLPVKDVPTGEYVEENIEDIVKRSDLPLALIVEDNAGLLTYLKKNLKQEYNVMGVQSAEKALTLLVTYKADIIITDIALQGMSGIELCQKVNSSNDLAHIPVIVVSAISSVETKMKCMESGATNYIEKPYSMDYLKACIKSALDKKAALRATYGGTIVSETLPDTLISRDEDFVIRLEKIVSENLSNPSFSSTQLGEMLFMGHSTLNRKMKALFDTTPNDYIRTRRLALAAEMLEKGNRRVNEVCYAVGFNSPSYFAKCFKKVYGVLPAEWGKKHE